MLEPQICDWCGSWTRPQFHQSKYICGRCRRPLADCCDGEQAQPDLKEYKQMNCYFCGTPLTWGGDHDVEDSDAYDMETNLSCQECDAFVLVYKAIEND